MHQQPEDMPFVYINKVTSRYEYLRPLGQGAYGYVCSAIDKHTNQKVAIKRIKMLHNPVILLRTLREIKILKHFRHQQNIISILNSIIPETYDYTEIFIVQEYMEADLHYIIQSNQILSQEHVKSLMFQLVSGLKVIHDANVIHRDLKPSNCLVNSRCVLKICDFGLARDNCYNYDDCEMSNYVQTRWYRAPELLLKLAKYNEKVDMWSVGCIFMEILTKVPFIMGSNEHDQISKIINIFGQIPESVIDNIPNMNIKHFVSQIIVKERVNTSTIFRGCDNEAVKFLGRLFSIDADERISSNDAVCHEYFKTFTAENICVEKYVSNLNEFPSLRDLRIMLYDEILELHKNEIIEKTIKVEEDILDA